MSNTRHTARTLASLVAALCIAACGSSPSKQGPSLDGSATVADGGAGDILGPAWSAPVGPCAVRTATIPSVGATHVSECAPLTIANSPPTSGPHYPAWPIFRIYDSPVPWGYLLHGMEHGVVVISYNCPGGCESDLQAARKMIAEATPKAGCVPPRPPIILAPDPTLPHTFTAVAWEHALQATCFDAEQMAIFVSTYANHGPEFFPTDCGLVDKETAGWCP